MDLVAEDIDRRNLCLALTPDLSRSVAVSLKRKKLERQESEFKSLSEQVKLVLERNPKHVKLEKKDSVLLRMVEKPHVSHVVREGMRLLLT
ncbi:hypothetical protein BV898_04191 [Hypsibius exemplaris]|uniref:Uncharacterized protein n=1 Tax=Hypsibius exemplaris TaxID=2072580 RepID=A0A1W0X3K1_HYPEX|nr:hypothetical protein BV898_04191 [Hypsibius exemplaris]